MKISPEKKSSARELKNEQELDKRKLEQEKAAEMKRRERELEKRKWMQLMDSGSGASKSPAKDTKETKAGCSETFFFSEGEEEDEGEGT